MARTEAVHEAWATYWSVDFHVHTPGSADARAENFGTAEDIVTVAISAGLNAICVTDHNTAEWCDAMSAAAKDTDLVVLPGVEITTTEGHLLAIWEERTPAEHIHEALVELGIKHADRGKLDIAATVGFAEAAKKVVAAGGIAIAAHADKTKGLLGLEVKAQVKRTLLEDCLAAVEITRAETEEEVRQKVKGERTIACVQGSDTWDSKKGRHDVSGIGARRTWIKASRPDLVGIRHALNDPELRIRLAAPEQVAYGRIDSIDITGGFLDGQHVALSPDLNCMLGGTGAGKSLTLEAVRFALDQQADARSFPGIRKEVDARLAGALGENGVVRVEVTVGGRRYQVERALSIRTPASPRVAQLAGDDWIEIDVDPAELLPLAAFSQGEILEYSRQPVGRMSLVDAGIDFGDLIERIGSVESQLRANALRLLAARSKVSVLEAQAAGESELNEQVRQLSSLFNTDSVKAQAGWATEDSRVVAAAKAIDALTPPSVIIPAGSLTSEQNDNKDVFERINAITSELDGKVKAAVAGIEAAIDAAKEAMAVASKEWEGRIAKFRLDLEAELKKVDPESTLTTLRSQLELLQGKQIQLEEAKTALTEVAQPDLAAAETEREDLLQALMDLRAARRELRRARVLELNAKAAGFVKLDVPSDGDFADFRAQLDVLKTGSRVREDVLDAIARYNHPVAFVRSILGGDLNALVKKERGIDSSSIARLVANIEDRKLMELVLEAQLVDRPDILTVKFRKPEDKQYAPIEELAHGQRSTAILVIMLADGNAPIIVDQPEDALHAPWIEDYLVDRLRSLRGTRQYVFATRSPGIVVSADAEQIITMRASAGRGEHEASGSLERHDLNKLVLHHLEGGPTAFERRTMKLAVSTSRK